MLPTFLTNEQMNQIATAFSEKTKQLFVSKKELEYKLIEQKGTTDSMKVLIDAQQEQINTLIEQVVALDLRLKEYEGITNMVDGPIEDFDWDNYQPKYTPEEDNNQEEG